VSTSVFHRRKRSTHDPELAGYVRLGEALTGAAGVLPDPSPEFRTSLRAMLVATAEREEIGTGAPERLPLVNRGRAKGAILVGLTAGTLALSGMSAASGNAMPGDPLYSVKRSTESAQLALAGSDVARGQLYLEFARNRLAEGQFDDMDADSRSAVRLLTAAAVDRHDRTGLDMIDAFVPRQRADLRRLGDSARIRQSLALLDQIAARSAALRPELACGNAPTGLDDLGVTPAGCQSGAGTRSTRAPHPEATTTAPTGTVGGTATTGSPSPTASPSGLLGDLGRILGTGH
jgi:hypothetical protein